MEEPGPFDRILQAEPPQRRDRAAILIVGVSVILGLLLLILVLPPISIFDDGDKPAISGPVTAVMREEFPPPPPGFEAVSALFDLSAPDSIRQPVRLTVDLSAPVSEGEQLSLFTYRDGGWRRLGDAIPLAEGNAAQGEVPVLPSNVAVLRPVEQARVVLGSLPVGAEPDPRALGALTTLNPTGFVPSWDGRISGGPLQLSADQEVAVAPTITASAPSEIETLDAILASADLRAAHVQAILEFARGSEFAGIDLDYQTIDPSLGDEFTALVRELSTGLHEEGRSLSLTLPLPVRQDEGWDTLGFDWQTLSSLVDAIKLAPELEQDRYYQRMEEALGFLVSRVGSSKLLLPVGTLSRERGVDGVRALTLTEALSLASIPITQPEGPVAPGSTVQVLGQNLAGEMGASGLRWDDLARAVVFSYTGPGGERTVWLANLFSEAFKLDLARRYQLGGVAVEDVSRQTEDANIWPAVLQYAQTGEVELVKPNGELLQPSWTVSGGALEGDPGALVTWRAPTEAGAYTFTLMVSDGVMRVGQQLQVAVQPPEGAVAP